MTTTKKSFRVTAVILSLAMLLGIVYFAGNASAKMSANAATEKVVSMYSSNVYFSKYGATSYEVFVQTKDAAADQKVYVHYNYLDNKDWQDVEATYFTTLSDGSKIWKATFSSYNAKYAIKYVADGNTFWDNNNGKDYTGSVRIGSAPVVSERLGYQYNSFNGYQINAVLQNYSYEKNVFVRYTTDGWKTSHDQALSYSKTNADGTETWTVNLKLNAETDGFEYAICYQDDKGEFWANSFGANYNIMYYVYR